MDLLYKDPKDINYIKKKNNYYNFTCFDILKDNLKIKSIYNILNHCDLNQLKNILNAINIQWNLIIIKLSEKNMKHNYKNKINNKCTSIEEFNTNVSNFVSDKIIGIVCINILLNYLHLY